MKVIDYKVSTDVRRTSDSTLVRSVTVEYQDGHFENSSALLEIEVGANDSDEDILRQCEEAIQPPVDNRTLARKVRETVDKFFGVCK